MGEETDISIELATDIYVERLHSRAPQRSEPSMRHRPLAAVAAGTLILVGCASTGGPPPSAPARPAVAVPDQVGAVDRALLIGNWSCHELNPVPGRPTATEVQVSFNPDGTGHNSAVVDTSQGGNPLGG